MANETPSDRKVHVCDCNNVKSGDFGANQNSLFNQAVNAVSAGIAYTAKGYMKMDNQNTPKNPERGTIPYDNSKSVFYY